MSTTTQVGHAQGVWLGLAPMEGVTDFATRLWAAQNGAPDFTTTPFLRVTKDYPSRRISANFLPEIDLPNYPGVVGCIPQLMASEIDDLILIAKYFLERVPFVDINCGCPSPTVVGHGAGSSLLQTPERFRRYLESIVAELGPQRVSVKMRVGFSRDEEFSRLLDVLKPLSLARVTIHGRTRADRYTGQARWSFIEQAARVLNCPVVGSGDVLDAETFKARIAQAPHVSGVIIGRGALRNPWIFSNLRDDCKPKIQVSRRLLKETLLQFILLQELQSQCWDQFIEQTHKGIFVFDFDKQSESSGERKEELNRRLAVDVLAKGESTAGFDVSRWPISRISLARGKMLWNYLRSGLNASPELTVALLRAGDWTSFLPALERLLRALPDNDVEIGYHPQWDWVYSGAGQGASEENKSG